MFSHKSVLEDEIASFFKELPITQFCDATLGLGGHSFRLLTEHPEAKLWVGCDQDEEALLIAKEKLSPFSNKMQFRHENFSDLTLPIHQFDGILVDLGISSLQLDKSDRGFSFMRDGPLDMRMNRRAELTAEIIVNEWPEEEIFLILKKYGEEKKSRKIAWLIGKARKESRIRTTQELSDILLPHIRDRKRAHHPLTLTFQALRIAVNQELDRISTFLPKAVKALKPGGRLAIISFHSLEDRIIKQFFQDAASDKASSSGMSGLFIDKKPELRLLTRKPLTPSEKEIEENPRARSAKLRIAEKIGDNLL